jgi:ribosome-binding ATPase
MKIGLIGLPNSGKTTIFNALTRSQSPVTAYANSKAEPNVAVIDVIDPRLDQLSDMYNPKKTTYAAIEFTDFVGMAEGSAREGLFSGSAVSMIKSTDALAIVVRNFQDELGESPIPLSDIGKIIDELLISDLILAENRLERIEHSYKRGKKSNALETEEKTLRKIVDHLGENRLILDFELDREQEKMVRGFQFLTLKPLLIVLNSDETRFGNNPEILADIEKNYRVMEFAGQFEMELSRLNNAEDEKLFMEDMGIRESARDRLARLAYDLVGYISFFTVGPDEVRAWNIHQGQTAVDAAGSIHSDLARGFIRAECIDYDDLVTYGSEKDVRDQGLLRLEGKNYIVRDGNILTIRFNV